MLLGLLVEIYEQYQKPVLESWIVLKTQNMLWFWQFWSEVAG